MAVIDDVRGMQMPFKADTCVYSVFVIGTTIKLSKIPAMHLMDLFTKTDVYRLDNPYFVSPMVSETVMKPLKHMCRWINLKPGQVYYTVNKEEAEAVAVDVRRNMLLEKAEQVRQLQAEIEVIQKIKVCFE